MDRLEILEKITRLEKRKQGFEGAYRTLQNGNTKGGTVNFNFVTPHFIDYYKGQKLDFDIDYMMDYLQNEINNLESKINKLVGELK